MKRLTLLRHAKADGGHPGLADVERPLNDRGRRAARRIGAFLADQELRFDRVIASPAVRVRDTLALVEAGYGRALTPEWDARLYLASLETFLAVVQGCSDEAERLLIAGHNPSVHQAVLALVPADVPDPQRDATAAKYPTAALVELEVEAVSWADCVAGTARLIRFTRPGDLDPLPSSTA